VQIAVGSDALWQRMAPAFGLDQPEWALNRDRVRDHDAVNAAVDAAFSGHSSSQVLATLASLGVPAGKVRDFEEVYTWEQALSQGLLLEVEHAALGRVKLPGPPLRFETDGRETGRAEHLAPPLLDQHGDQVRRWLDETLR
jgi:crotonobetainyl-CoA:carnitine CoA-transferase CaiB-like acyl-CoA transferase